MMTLEYENMLYSEEQLQSHNVKSMDMPIQPLMAGVLVVAWALVCLAGLAVILKVKMVFLGICIIAIPTFLGMVMWPTFAMCVMMLVIPTGAGVGISGVFSLDRGIGIAVAVSFLLNIMITRPSLSLSNKSIWVFVCYCMWIVLTSLRSPNLSVELSYVFTQLQLLALTVIVYWIVRANGKNSMLWILRSYLFGTLSEIILTYITGAAMMTEQSESGRFSATLGTEYVDANMIAGMFSLAFLSCVYLFVKDKRKLFRAFYLLGLVFLPLMLLKTGSRGAIIALAFTLLSPMIFLKQVVRKPALIITVLLLIVIASVVAGDVILKSDNTKLSGRLTNVQSAKKSSGYRIQLIKDAFMETIKKPMGTTRIGWISRYKNVPHNDFAYALGIYGYPAAAMWSSLILLIVLTVKKMPFGNEKLCARSLLIFLLVPGLSLTQLAMKHYWIFIAIILAMERFAVEDNPIYNYDQYNYEEDLEYETSDNQ
ncbi:MAG: O-antigen ligase family protein [Phycisphaerae bacterium]|nr:O-antigen ligase family protein [Phycisphaerae bacterium]